MIDIIVQTILVLVAIISCWYTYKMYKKPKAFKKIAIDFSLIDQSLIHSPRLKEIFFGCSINSINEEDIIICFLPFQISNIGKLSIKNINIRFAFPLIIRSGGFKNNLSKIMDPLDVDDGSKIKRKDFIEKGIEYVRYKIPDLNPKESIIIKEIIEINHSSGVSFNTNAISADKIPLIIKSHIKYTTQIDFSISATNVALFKGHFIVKSYQFHDIKELAKKIQKDETLSLRKKLSKIGTPKNFISKAYAPFSKIVIIPKLEKIPKPKKYSTIKGCIYMEKNENPERCLVTSDKNMIQKMKKRTENS